jgi:hypothetical protein
MRHLVLHSALAAIAMCVSVSVHAGYLLVPPDEEVMRLVRDDVAGEAAACSVYFALTAAMMERSLAAGSDRDKEVTDWVRSSNAALAIADAVGNKEKTSAVVKLTGEHIKRVTNGSFENFAVVAAEYAYPCKDLIDEPTKRVAYWMEKEELSLAGGKR